MRCARCHRLLKDPASMAAGYGRKCYIKAFGKRPDRSKCSRVDVKSASPDEEQLPGQLSVYDLEYEKSAGQDGQRETLQNG